MAAGSGFGDEHHQWHARRRWVEARNDWFRQHPDADRQRLAELLEGWGRRELHRPASDLPATSVGVAGHAVPASSSR